MKFITHTINWYKGEGFEATITALWGLLLMVVALIFWQAGKTQGSQAMVIPLLIVGLIVGASGSYNVYKNKQKVVQLEKLSLDSELEFVQAEKERVEGFQYLYTFTKFLALGLFAAALIIFFFVENKTWQAVGIAMIIMGLSGLVIDYFSQERADEYYGIIVKSIDNKE